MLVQNANSVRFGPFEADFRELELRKRGVRQKIQDQPFQVLAILLRRSGELVSRDELRQAVWPADTFVDFDHSLNTAINKIREVLGDSAASPHYIETVPRRGYRFIGAIESDASSAIPQAAEQASHPPEDINQLPTATRGITRLLFALVQTMYLVFYVAALIKLETIHRTVETFAPDLAPVLQIVILLLAVLAIPTRLYLLSAVSFDYRGLGVKFRRLFPALMLADFFWALSPFLMVQWIGVGSAFAATAALLYLPFSQRTLIRMAYPEPVAMRRKES